MLFARLQLQAPSARSILITAPHSGQHLSKLAGDLARAIISSGARVRLLDVTPSAGASDLGDDVERMDVLESEMTDLERARRALNWPSGYTVLCAGGVMDSPAALILGAASDGVLLVARAGKTMRADLIQARDDIESSGGTVVGSVLLG
jgi:Mrp family chromosome partitioning ATPase